MTNDANVELPMHSRTPMVVLALALFSGMAWFFFAGRGAWVGDMVGLLGGGLSVIAITCAVVALVNLTRHEGWAVVLTKDGIELPGAPLRSSRRDRIPYTAIEAVAFSPDPPAEPEIAILHVKPGPTFRFVRARDLESGSVRELLALLIERVRAAHGDEGVPAKFEYH